MHMLDTPFISRIGKDEIPANGWYINHIRMECTGPFNRPIWWHCVGETKLKSSYAHFFVMRGCRNRLCIKCHKLPLSPMKPDIKGRYARGWMVHIRLEDASL